MSFYHKYIKYKSKYLNLKGGSIKDVDKLYKNLDCKYWSSNKDLGIPSKELTYGELTKKGFLDMLRKGNVDTKGKHFYDLGSGNGKLIMYAVFNANFNKATGIEIDPEKHQCAMKFWKKHTNFDKRINLIEGNFFEKSLIDVDVIFVSSLCFTEETLKKLGKKIVNETKPGTKLFTSSPLNSKNLQLVNSFQVEQTWSKNSTIYHYLVL
jgi:SAM-dependent methyltransferase